MKTTIYNLIILDASGSMQCIKKQAMDGFNETVQTIKAAQEKFVDQKQLVSLVVFNTSETNLVYDRVLANDVKELNDRSYIPSSCTPLYDAIGNAVIRLGKYTEEQDQVLVTIITDGEENASNEFNGQSVKSLIDQMKEKGWVFTYIGANQDVEQVAATMGIKNTMEFTSDECGTKAMFQKERSSRMSFFTRVFSGESKASLQENYFDDEDGKF